MWGVLGNAATVVKLVGFDAAGLIAKIRQAARTAQQNNKDCELLARRVDMLPRLMRQDPEAVRALAGLDGTLSEAHELIPAISYICITSRLDANHTTSRSQSQLVLVPRGGRAAKRAGPYRADRPIGCAGADKSLSGVRWPIGRKISAHPSLSLTLAPSLPAAPPAASLRWPVKRLNAARQGAEDAFFKEQRASSHRSATTTSSAS